MPMDIPTAMSPHKAEACRKLSPIGQKLFRFVEFDDEEELLAEIRKHPFGLFLIVITGIFISLTILFATTVLSVGAGSSGAFDQFGNTPQLLLIIFGLLLTGLGLVATFVIGIIYRSNVVFVTNQKIAEVMYISLFNRRIIQLGIGSVEDVTVSQKGIFPRIFNYGMLLVETAGELENCTFTYVPKPNETSQLIIQTHEVYVQKYGN